MSPLGPPDFTGDPWYSYDDPPAGQTNPELKHFSVEKDRGSPGKRQVGCNLYLVAISQNFKVASAASIHRGVMARS